MYYCIYNYNHKNIIYIYICTCLPILKFLECMFVELVIDTAYVQHVHLEWWQQTLTNQNKLLSMSLVRAFVQPFREAPCNGVAKTPRVSVYVINVPVKRVKSGERETRPWTGRLDSNCIPVFKPCFEYKIRVLTCMVDHNMVAKHGVSICTKAVQMAVWMSLTNGAPVGQLHSKCLGMMMDSCPELFLPLKPVWKENKSLSHPFNLNTYRKQWKVKTSSCFLHKSDFLTMLN